MNKDTANNGVGLLGLVFLVFLVLKLCKVIGWSWWWVTAPLWGGIALLAVFVILGIITFGVSYLAHRIKNKK